MADGRLITALDFPTMEEAVRTVEELDNNVCYYKVGMELYYAAGASIITYLKEKGKKVFLDLKLQDIPITVARALSVLTGLGVDMINVHTIGGSEMMRAAAKSVKEKALELGIPAPKLLGVTILTSINEEQWGELGYSKSIKEQVVALALLAKECGLDGVIASPQEAASIREACGEDFLIVTPGVRPVGACFDDQSRIATPKAALRNGATHLVVGRPITQAENKKIAAANIVSEMALA